VDTSFIRQQLVNRCSPEDERASREGERHDLTRLEAEDIQTARQVSSKMGSRAAVCDVEFAYHAKQGHKVHTFLHGAWLRGGPANRHRLRQPTSTGLHRRGEPSRALLTVYIRVKVQVDLQADKSPVVVKGPFFPQVANPRYRIRGTNV
jgi:hypothetical protein